MTDEKKDYYSAIYGIESFAGTGAVSHEFLANIMPFYCCWLSDSEDESKPCRASIGAGSLIFALRMHDITHNPNKIYIN